MTKRFAILIFILITSLCATAQIGKVTVQPMTEARLKAVAKTANESCPEVLNNDTRLDSVRYCKGMILCNYYTMPNVTAKEVIALRKKSGDDKNDEGAKLPGNTYRIQHKFYDGKGVYMFTKTQYQ